jgi:hypothetical protein
LDFVTDTGRQLRHERHEPDTATIDALLGEGVIQDRRGGES